ncbi:MAG TPA: M23 family metallopeptidase [Terriglobia bacterium]|nr:M23 family metallopeptidase [Terriglobia bacterium]
MKQLIICVLAACMAVTMTYAQTPSSLEGKWEGALAAGPNQLRLVLNISKAADDLYLGTLTSVDQGGVRIPIDKIQQTGDSVRLEVKAVNGIFEGSISEDKTKLKGTWTQGGPKLPLELTRTGAAAEAPKPPDAAVAAAAAVNSPFGVPVEMTVPIAPTPFAAAGKIHLVYELHVTNFGGLELPLSKLEVLNGETTVAGFEAADLNSLLARPGAANLSDNRVIGPGMRAIAYVWITLDAGTPVPASLRHRLTGRNQTVTGAPVTVSTAKPIVLGPPLKGENWIAANGPANGSVHRRALIPLNGNVHLAQRFAIDWVQINPGGRTFEGDEKDNKTHKAYGNDVLAVADGVVAAVQDGIPENVPGPASRAVPITPETIGGNHVILDVGGGRFAFYAHMQPGNLRVKVGDKVRRGQVIGLVGNSGNSTEPHLHFHVTDGNSPLESEGLPYVLESFEVQSAPNTWEPRQNELPLQNSRVRFPEVK